MTTFQIPAGVPALDGMLVLILMQYCKLRGWRLEKKDPMLQAVLLRLAQTRGLQTGIVPSLPPIRDSER